MKKNLHFLSINVFCFFCLFTCALQAQIVVRGSVFDEKTAEKLIGATVQLKSAGQGTVTDYDGQFELKIAKLPVTLVFSYIGYTTKELVVSNTKERVNVQLSEEANVIEEVVIKSRNATIKQESPQQVISISAKEIQSTTGNDFYRDIGQKAGVDVTAAAIGFQIINTRGFNSTSPVRSLQVIDGVDNQAPGLNFSLGNFLGTSQLDVNRFDLVVGASSAFYGPNAFNGVVSMETKNPFLHRGLAASVKAGERNLLELAVRWGDAIKNKQGKDVVAYKVNLFNLRADDWRAENYDPVSGTTTSKSNPGRYDNVNIYGDEYFSGNDLSKSPKWLYVGLNTWHRTGYREVDLVDYNTQNTKANAAVHIRTQPNKEFNSPELILSTNLGTGTTVYQGDNRYSLKNILFFQNRIEFQKRDKYFIRAYMTKEDAGDSYDPYFTALILQRRAKSDVQWSTDYVNYWRRNFEPRTKELGYPQLSTVFNPDGTITTNFDDAAATAWLLKYNDTLSVWHTKTAAAADLQSTLSGSNFLKPGTPEFAQAFKEITSKKANIKEGGTRFYDKSALYHVHGEYRITPKFTDYIVVGANARLYTPNSDGTIFQDSIEKITNFEYGVYTGLEKKIDEGRWKFNATIRMDKNQNFDYLFSPAVSAVYSPRKNDYLRISFSSAIRNPTLGDQYLYYNVGRAILLGNLNGVKNLITVPSLLDYFEKLRPNVLKYFDVAPIKPEKVKTVEIGYRTTLFDKLFIDAGYYFSFYNDFIGFNIGVDAAFDPNTGFPTRLQAYRVAANSINTVTTQGFTIGTNYYLNQGYILNANYSWNKLNVNDKIADDPIVPAFNTPEHKFNIGISNPNLPFSKNLGFSANYRWVQGFQFEGSPQFTGQIPSYGLLDAQVSYNVPKWNMTFKAGGSNVLNNKHYEVYGGPLIGRLLYVNWLYNFDKKDKPK